MISLANFTRPVSIYNAGPETLIIDDSETRTFVVFAASEDVLCDAPKYMSDKQTENARSWLTGAQVASTTCDLATLRSWAGRGMYDADEDYADNWQLCLGKCFDRHVVRHALDGLAGLPGDRKILALLREITSADGRWGYVLILSAGSRRVLCMSLDRHDCHGDDPMPIESGAA